MSKRQHEDAGGEDEVSAKSARTDAGPVSLEEFEKKSSKSNLIALFHHGLQYVHGLSLPLVYNNNGYEMSRGIKAATYALLTDAQRALFVSSLVPGTLHIFPEKNGPRETIEDESFLFYKRLELTEEQDKLLPFYYLVGQTVLEGNRYGERADVQYLVTAIIGAYNNLGKNNECEALVPFFEATIVTCKAAGWDIEIALECQVYFQVCLAILTGYTMADYYRTDGHKGWMIDRFRTTMDYNFPEKRFINAAHLKGCSRAAVVAHYILADRALNPDKPWPSNPAPEDNPVFQAMGLEKDLRICRQANALLEQVNTDFRKFMKQDVPQSLLELNALWADTKARMDALDVQLRSHPEVVKAAAVQ